MLALPPPGMGTGTTGMNGGMNGSPSDAAEAALAAVSAREAAVCAALRVLNKVLALDGRFLEDVGRAMGGGAGGARYQPLDAHLKAAAAAVPGGVVGAGAMVVGGGVERRLLATLLEYVCYQDSEEIQVGAGVALFNPFSTSLYIT